MWSGLIRRFSSDLPESYGHNGHPPEPSHLSHAHTEPAGGGGESFQDGINGVFFPSHQPIRTASPFRPPPLDPIVLHGYKESTSQSARLLSHGVAEEIRIMLPERLRIKEDWRLIYSLEQDGASLATLYQKAAEFQGQRVGFVLVVRDDLGGVSGNLFFGCSSLCPTCRRSRRPQYCNKLILCPPMTRLSAPTSPNIHTPRPSTLATANASSGAPQPSRPSRRHPPPIRRT